jgi:hypothetical protein
MGKSKAYFRRGKKALDPTTHKYGEYLYDEPKSENNKQPKAV